MTMRVPKQAASALAPRTGRASPSRQTILGVMREKASAGSKAMCGPDVTHWFMAVVEAAKREKEVLAIKEDLAMANRTMSDLGLPDIGLLAMRGVDEQVTQAWEGAGKPAMTGAAQGQRASAASGFFALGQAERRVGTFGTGEAALLAGALGLLKRAAMTWKSLVQTGAPFDFKANILANPISKHCRGSCEDKITITLSGLCFEKDVPGNLFYAHIGRFIGWNELTLQLGSQFAQLLATREWDPPRDTALIRVGYGLPEPLTAEALGAALRAGGGPFSEPCAPCGESMSGY